MPPTEQQLREKTAELIAKLPSNFGAAVKRIEHFIEDLVDPGKIGGGLDPGLVAQAMIGCGIGMFASAGNHPNAVAAVCAEILDKVYETMPK